MTDASLQVDIRLVRQAAQILLDHLGEIRGDVVELDVDYFWSLSPEELYEISHEPDVSAVGQVSESLEWLEGIVNNRSPAISYGLVWLADVMRALGHAVVE